MAPTSIGVESLFGVRVKVCLAGIIATAAAATVAPQAQASCAAGISWKQRFYTAAHTLSPLEHGSRLHGGTYPGCDDFIVMEGDERVNEPPPDRPAKLVRLRGISPHVAVGVAGERRTAYLAPGFLVGLPSHPLHRQVFRDEVGDERRSLRCSTRRRRLDGRVPWQPRLGMRFVVGSGSREVDVAVDGRTVITGSERAGLPYFRKGDRLVVDGLRCRAPYSDVLARRIRIISR